MELVNQFFTEILAAIIILTLTVMYLILKNSKKPLDASKKKEKKKEVTPQEELVKDEFDNEDAIFTKVPEKTIKKPEAEPVKVVEEEVKEEPIPQTKKRVKREVIAHDKITKNHFEEFDGTKILIAEDNIINQKVILGLLSTSGIKITIANDGQEALNILEEDSNFSLILMDAHMPIVDGFQATRFIRKNPNYEHIPIVALSGDTAADDIRNMLNVGMEGHLEKPLKMDALYDILYMYTTGDEANQVEVPKVAVAQEEVREPSSEVSNMEFNIEKGLEICGGDKGFYLEILNEFIGNYTNASTQLKDFINNKDSRNADKMLLDISGVAANIGADSLYHITLELKKAIANPDDLEYITSLKDFKRALEHANQLINEYINS